VDRIIRHLWKEDRLTLPYVMLIYDWLRVLDSRDRTRLRESFLLKLRELQGRNTNTAVTERDVFEAMEFGAYSASLIPAIVESLVLDGYVRMVDNVLNSFNREKRNAIELKNGNAYSTCKL
jgi:hypothetical protein